MPEDPDRSIRFALTVHKDLMNLARDTLRRECDIANESIVVELIPQHEEARLWVTLTAAAYDKALHVLIGELPAAEFGALRYLKTVPQSASYRLAA